MVPIVLFYGLISGVFTFGKQAILHVKPLFLTSIRLPFAGMIMLAFQYIYKREQLYFHRACSGFLLGYGITLFVGDAFRFIAMVTIPAANASLIAATGPFITAIAAHFLLKEYLTLRKAGALLLGFISVLPLIVNNLLLPTADQSMADIALGYSASLISVVGFVGTSYCLKVLTSHYKYPPLTAAGVGTMIGGIVGLLCSIGYEAWHISSPMINMQEGFPLLILLFVGHNIIGYPVYAYLINKYPVTLVSFGQLLLPIFTVLMRYFLFNDPIPYIFALSLCLLSVSFYLFYAETLALNKKNRSHEKAS